MPGESTHAITPARDQLARQFWTSPFNPASDTAIGRTAFASAGLFESVTRRYGKPAWGLETIDIDGHVVRTTEQGVWSSPWCRLVRFKRDAGDTVTSLELHQGGQVMRGERD